MELLAPAGSWDAMVACIEAGADAVYGGIDRWNARQRADNFTVEQLSAAVTWCHERGRRFYLTLNTLLRDQEVTAVLDLLGSATFPPVDALIVADMGVIATIHDRLPHFAIHASTQFGAHNLTDIAWLREHGVERVILPREATFDEIRQLSAIPGIKTEVFVWGSRCICFSGDCTLSWALAGGSGDRGRCIGVCRDLYRRGGHCGQWLYPHDLDVGRWAREFASIGVAAVKIEGRRRPPKELSAVVSGYSRILTESEDKAVLDVHIGWLSGQREWDWHVRGGSESKGQQSGSESLRATARNEPTPNTGLHQRFIDVLLASRLEGKWDVRATTDEGELLCIQLPGTPGGEVDSLPSRIGKEGWRLRELKLSNPHQLGLNSSALTSALQAVLSRSVPDQLPSTTQTAEGAVPPIHVEVDSIEQALLSLRHGADMIICRVSSSDDVLQYRECVPKGKLIVRLPMFDWNSQGITEVLNVLEDTPALATRWNQLPELSQRGIPFGCDASMDIWNCHSLSLARRFGIRYITSSLDWSLAESYRFARMHAITTEVVIAGRPTLGWTRLRWCSSACTSTTGCCRDVVDLDFASTLRVICTPPYMTEFVASQPIALVGLPADCGPLVVFRYIASHDDKREIGETMSILRSRPLPLAQWASRALNAGGVRQRLLRSAQ